MRRSNSNLQKMGHRRRMIDAIVRSEESSRRNDKATVERLLKASPKPSARKFLVSCLSCIEETGHISAKQERVLDDINTQITLKLPGYQRSPGLT